MAWALGIYDLDQVALQHVVLCTASLPAWMLLVPYHLGQGIHAITDANAPRERPIITASRTRIGALFHLPFDCIVRFRFLISSNVDDSPLSSLELNDEGTEGSRLSVATEYYVRLLFNPPPSPPHHLKGPFPLHDAYLARKTGTWPVIRVQ